MIDVAAVEFRWRQPARLVALKQRATLLARFSGLAIAVTLKPGALPGIFGG